MTAQRMGGRRLWLTAVFPALLLLGCGEDDGTGDRAAQVVSRRDAAGLPQDLTCSTGRRESGSFDYSADARGADSPLVAAKSFAAGDEIVLDEATDHGPAVWVLRPDGTAHTRLGLRQTADGTWLVDGQESCSDRTGPSS
jgi:hypothetical protein